MVQDHTVFTLYKQAGRLDLLRALGRRMGSAGDKLGKGFNAFNSSPTAGAEAARWLTSGAIAAPVTYAEYHGYNPLVAQLGERDTPIPTSEALAATAFNTIAARYLPRSVFKGNSGMVPRVGSAVSAFLTTPVVNISSNLFGGGVEGSKNFNEIMKAIGGFSDTIRSTDEALKGAGPAISSVTENTAKLMEGVGDVGPVISRLSQRLDQASEDLVPEEGESNVDRALGSLEEIGKASKSVAETIDRYTPYMAPAAGATLGVVLGRLLQQPLPRDVSERERRRISRNNLIRSILLGIAGAGTGMAASGNNPVALFRNRFRP